MITALDTNTALVLIDLQQGIVSGAAAMGSDKVVANAARLAQAFRNANMPVVLVHVNPIGAPWTLVRAQESALPKDPEAQKEAEAKMQASGYFNIVPELQIQTGDIMVTKRTWNAFYETGLHEALQEREITGIVLGGISTSIGVEGTARAASERGYNICFAKDAMLDRVEAAHNNSLQYIFPRIGEIDTVDAIVEKLHGNLKIS